MTDGMKTPYRTLPVERRLELVTHEISSHREVRDRFIASIVARGGGFRPEKLRKWPAERLAREVVRHNLETAQDELGLMVTLYVELDPSIQIAFFDSAGVTHQNGSMVEDAEPPFAAEDRVREAARVVEERFGEDGRRYLRTIALYNGAGWPGLDAAP